MLKSFSFSPEDPYEKRTRKRKAYRPKEKGETFNWRAPDHMAMTKDMQRDFPRDDRGDPLRGSKRDVLVLDPRPVIMRPERTPYQAI